MKKYTRLILFSSCIISILLFAHFCLADEILLKDGKKVKGLIIEEFSDRVVFNTFEGEKIIPRADIVEVYYDDKAQQYYSLGKRFEEKNLLNEAALSYEKALALDKNFKSARQALFMIRSRIWKQQEQHIREDLMLKRQMIENVRQTPMAAIQKNPQDVQSPEENKAYTLWDKYGIALEKSSDMVVVMTISPVIHEMGSDIDSGDIIVKVWNSSIMYESAEEVSALILSGDMKQVALTVEKEIVIPVGAGARLGFDMRLTQDGLTVTFVRTGSLAAKYKLKRNDLIIGINGQPTTYMPIRDASRLLQRPDSDGNIRITARRKVYLIRKQ
jgi:hypothetical protein